MLRTIPCLIKSAECCPKRLTAATSGLTQRGYVSKGAPGANKAQPAEMAADERPGQGARRADGSQQHANPTTTRRALPVTNEPFAKNLFLGKFDTRMLIFPEVLEKEEVEELNQMVEPVRKYFSEVDSTTMDRTGKIPEEAMQQMRDFGLFGLQIPQEYGGLGFNATRYARMTEATSLDGGLGVTLGAHGSIGLKGIILMGTEAQKAEYLPKLATGEYIASFCLTEATSGSDAASIQARAVLSPDGQHYLLTGSKLWISNGGIADIFTVFAKTPVANHKGEVVDKVTAFIVERKFGGVTSGKPEDKLGIRGSNTCEVHFDNTPVPIKNVLGEVGGGFKVAVTILNSGRFSVGAGAAGGIRYMMKSVVEHAIQRKQFGKSLSEFGLIQEKFALMAMDVYAMESMAYITAGILDSYSQPDASIEAAMVKVYGSEAAFRAASEAIQIFGGAGFMKEFPYERLLRDTRILLIFEGTNEILRLYIALMCLQHAGMELRDTVKRMRDPLNNVGFMFRKGFERIQTNRKNPALNMKLYNHVHPSLSHSGEALELRVVKLRYMVEKYLSTYADKMVDHQQALKRFADIAIDMYGMTSCLARASRSKSIGLRNHDHEVLMARTFCGLALRRIDAALRELDEGEVVNGDLNMREIADAIFKNGGYAAEHPLERNW